MQTLVSFYGNLAKILNFRQNVHGSTYPAFRGIRTSNHDQEGIKIIVELDWRRRSFARLPLQGGLNPLFGESLFNRSIGRHERIVACDTKSSDNCGPCSPFSTKSNACAIRTDRADLVPIFENFSRYFRYSLVKVILYLIPMATSLSQQSRQGFIIAG